MEPYTRRSRRWRWSDNGALELDRRNGGFGPALLRRSDLEADGAVDGDLDGARALVAGQRRDGADAQLLEAVDLARGLEAEAQRVGAPHENVVDAQGV